MAELLVEKGWFVTVLTNTPIGDRLPIHFPFQVVRSVSLRSLFLNIASADVLVINGGIALPAALISVLRRTPFVIWHQMAGSLLRKGAIGALRNWLSNFVARRAAVHVGVSSACIISKELGASARRVVVHNPVAPVIESAARAQDAKAAVRDIDVLYVGRFIDGKGVLVLVEALKIVGSKLGSVSVALVGCGPLQEKVSRALASVESVQASLPGALEVGQLADYYRRSNCLVLPSTTHPEGMPLVISEAHTFGLPVVASDQPANIEAVGDGGIICQRGDATELATAILRILTDENFRERLSACAKRIASRYRHHLFGETLDKLLREAIGIQPPS